jgi:hypothetical protein
MDVVRAATVAALLGPACYSPSLRDCTLGCAAATDCANGQVCGADHLCAAPAIAGRCTADAGGDATRDGDGADAAIHADARPPDATSPADARPPDAAPTITIHVHVDGKGRVVLGSGGTCSHDCMLQAVLGVANTLTAIPRGGSEFDAWSGAACTGQGPICAFTPATNLDVHATFDGA